MNKFDSKTMPLSKLFLDTENPRFITPPNATEQDIINYLLEYEEVEELAKSINNNRGLYAGERIIVYNEDDKYIVLEGNRRVSACKILVNKQLLANYRPYSAANLIVYQDTIDNISNIEVDIMKSRIEAHSSLAAKHIDGIRKWSPISKHKFFSKEFSRGKAIDEIHITTGSTKRIIIKGIKEYNFVNYALNLDEWQRKEQNTIINIQKIKISPFTRVFTSSPQNPNYPTLSQILKLSFNDRYVPVTSLNLDVFNHCIYLVAKASFDKTIPFDTRSTFEAIPQLGAYLEEHGLLSNYNNVKPDIISTSVNANTLINKNDNVVSSDNSKLTDPVTIEYPDRTSTKETASTKEKSFVINKALTSSRSVLIPPTFIGISSSSKINNIINELKQINLNFNINAAAVLLRVLIELCAKYYLNNNNVSDLIKEKDLMQTINNALNTMRVKNIINDKVHSNLIQLGNSEKSFSIFNGYVHYDDILPIKSELIGYYDNYSVFIEKCLLTK